MSYNTTTGDEYTPEKLAELRKNAKAAPAVKKPEDDIQVVLKNTTPLARREGTYYPYYDANTQIHRLQINSRLNYHCL